MKITVLCRVVLCRIVLWFLLCFVVSYCLYFEIQKSAVIIYSASSNYTNTSTHIYLHHVRWQSFCYTFPVKVLRPRISRISRKQTIPIIALFMISVCLLLEGKSPEKKGWNPFFSFISGVTGDVMDVMLKTLWTKVTMEADLLSRAICKY